MVDINNKSPLQSKAWADIKSKHGTNTVWTDEQSPQWISVKSVPVIGKFGYVPHFWTEAHKIRSAERAIETAAKQNGLSFVLIDPFLTKDTYAAQEPLSDPSGLESIQQRFHMTLDTKLSDDELMSNMQKKHRQKLRSLLKDESITVEHGNSADHAQRFTAILDTATTRDNYGHYPAQYYQDIITGGNAEFRPYVTIVSKDGQDIAANLINAITDYAFQLFSGITDVGKKLSAGLLLTWHAAQEARRQGIDTYIQWGVIAMDQDGHFDPNDKLYGIAEFKRRFGGQYLELANQRVIINNAIKFRLYKLITKLRQK